MPNKDTPKLPKTAARQAAKMIQLHDARQTANMVPLNGEQRGRQTAKMVPVGQTATPAPQAPASNTNSKPEDQK